MIFEKGAGNEKHSNVSFNDSSSFGIGLLDDLEKKANGDFDGFIHRVLYMWYLENHSPHPSYDNRSGLFVFVSGMCSTYSLERK